MTYENIHLPFELYTFGTAYLNQLFQLTSWIVLRIGSTSFGYAV